MIALIDHARVADIGGHCECYYFNSEWAHLCITPDAAALVNQVYTIALSAGQAAPCQV